MTKEELINKLRELEKAGDPERNHFDADELLLDYINDDEVRKAFKAFEKWYA